MNVRLEEEIFENLKRYIAYAGRGDFSHVVNNGMRYLFSKTRGFNRGSRSIPSHYRGHQEEATTKPLQQSKAATHRDVPTGTVSCGCL